MRPNTTHVVSKGSNIWLDDAAMEYLRLPKGETPRERPEWSDERAGALQDAVWHPMLEWRITYLPGHDRLINGLELGVCGCCPGLAIKYQGDDGGEYYAWFPNAREI